MRSALVYVVINYFLVAGITSLTLSTKLDRREVVEQLRIGREPFEAMKEMHNMWYVHSLKGLLVQMAKELLRKLDKVAERDLLLCLHRIREKTDIVRASECLVTARQTLFETPALRAEAGLSAFIVGESVEEEMEAPTVVKPRKYKKPTEEHFRVKRSEYRLVEQEGAKKQRSRVRKLAHSPNLLTPGLTPVQRFSKAVLSVVNGKEDQNTGAWAKTYKTILSMKKGMDEQYKSPAARMYDLPMDRLVFDKNANYTGPPKLFPRNVRMPDMVERAFSLADSVRAHSSNGNKDANVKMLSPRFAPVMPDKYEGRGSLSPSILAFYKDDAEDQIVPLPSLLKATGMQKKDRDSLLEMIMEISGARETVDAAFETLQKINLFGVEGPFLEVAKKLEEAFLDLEKSFTRRQKAEMKKRKFSFLSKTQLKKLYAKQGIESKHHEEFDLDAYDKLTHKQRDESLWKRIEIFAANGTEPIHGHRRSKRDVPGETDIENQLYVLDSTVLHPYMFKPIYGLSVLGPTVLSPSLFSPLILNPSVISPWVLSPAIGMPFILSPYLLSPYVLSPMVFDPFILSPYVLSPNVINPYVLSPLILSPLALCPDVMSPMVIGGNILSPSFASPQIFSKNTLTASVLSPSFLS